MNFIIQALWALLFVVAAELLRPKNTPPGQNASALSDVQLPTASEGRSIAWVFGTCLVEAANVTWYGALIADAITQRVRTGLFSKKTITTGYRYSLSIQMMICWGVIDDILDILFDDRSATATRVDSAESYAYTVNAPSLFGGDEREGGVAGSLIVYKGTTTQGPDPVLQTLIGSPISAYQRVCHAAFRSFYFGTSPYIKKVAFVVRRCPNTLGLTAGRHNISGDANPACVIYEALTDQIRGANISSALFDTASFIACGNTLFNEGIGVSIQVNQGQTAEDFVSTVLKHVDGVIFSDIETGLITMKLSRNDYVVGSIPVLDSSSINELQFTRGSWPSTKNTVRVKYVRRDAAFQERTVQYQDRANIAARGGIVSAADQNLDGFSRPEAANWAASRLGKTYAYPLARVEFRSTRSAATRTLRPGGVFRLQYELAEETIDAVFRIGDISYGTHDNPFLKIVAVEDIFSVDSNAFDSVPPSAFVPPNTDPVAATRRLVQEAPYYELQQSLSAADLAALTSTQGFLSAALSRPTSLTIDAYLHTQPPGGAYAEESTIDFAPSATLSAAITPTTTVLPISGVVDLANVQLETYAMIAGLEAVRVTAIDVGGGTVTVDRGALDTVARAHASGGLVMFVAGTAAADDTVYPSGAVVNAKMTTGTPSGVLPLASAPVDSVTFAGRQFRPYPPGRFRINGQAYPASIDTAPTVTWAHRNRLTQGLIGDSNTGVTTEAGVTYNLRFYDHTTSALLQNNVGLTGNSHTAPAFAGPFVMRIELESQRESVLSRQLHSWVLNYTYTPISNDIIEMLFNGGDGSTAFTDAGSAGSTWVRSGAGVTESAAQVLEGVSSLRITGATDFLETDYVSANRLPATGDFDLFFRFRIASGPTAPSYLLAVYDATSSPTNSVMSVYYTGGALEFYLTSAANSFVMLVSATISVDTNYTYEIRRRNTSFSVYRNGSSVGSATFADPIKTGAGLKWRIGKPPTGNAAATFYFDEFRLSTYS